MQESARRRLEKLGSHFNLVRPLQALQLSKPAALDVAALQRLLEHDNWETRRKLKELMHCDLFIP